MKVKNPGGAPRKYDYEEIGEKLLEWSKLDNSINMLDFCVNYLEPPICYEYLWDMQDRDKKLSNAYKIAKARVGIRREKFLSAGNLHQAAYNKVIKHYCPIAKQEYEYEKKCDYGQVQENLAQAMVKLAKKSCDNE